MRPSIAATLLVALSFATPAHARREHLQPCFSKARGDACTTEKKEPGTCAHRMATVNEQTFAELACFTKAEAGAICTEAGASCTVGGRKGACVERQAPDAHGPGIYVCEATSLKNVGGRLFESEEESPEPSATPAPSATPTATATPKP